MKIYPSESEYAVIIPDGVDIYFGVHRDENHADKWSPYVTLCNGGERDVGDSWECERTEEDAWDSYNLSLADYISENNAKTIIFRLMPAASKTRGRDEYVIISVVGVVD